MISYCPLTVPEKEDWLREGCKLQGRIAAAWSGCDHPVHHLVRVAEDLADQWNVSVLEDLPIARRDVRDSLEGRSATVRRHDVVKDATLWDLRRA